MANCLLYYGTSEGQTEKIAGVLASDLRELGHTVDLVRGPATVEAAKYDAVIVGDSVHVGRFHRHTRRFVERHRTLLTLRPSAFYSVCLSVASKNEEDRDAGDQIGRRFLTTWGWEPWLYQTFAGALKNSRYGFVRRRLMQRIAAQSGYRTALHEDYEYTDWEAVHHFARAFGQLLDASSERSAANPPERVAFESVTH